MIKDVNKILDEVFSLYEKFGNADYIGEPVSQIEHMSQAAQLAMKEGYDDEVVLAAFFHDIGHICEMQSESNSMDGYGVKSHEKIGAGFLREKGFPERVAKLVENHVQAKRYLTYKFPEYYESLSEASKKTLEFQGGPMGGTEAEAFESDILFETSIRMRKWDELAKEMNVALLNLEEIKSKARMVLSR
jgi:2-amino-1-hydroxyethylphosphonate dioxygenase (glycine-forming)